MVINGVIERKLRLLEQRLNEIKEWDITEYSKFKKSSLQINAVERALTVCVEIMIDVSERILAIKKLSPRNSSIENFQELEKIKVIQSYDRYADMVDKELLSRKISNLSYYISELKNAKDINWKKYTGDSRSRAFVERYLHLSIEEIFDIANHLVSFCRWREPTGYRDSFDFIKKNPGKNFKEIKTQTQPWYRNNCSP